LKRLQVKIMTQKSLSKMLALKNNNKLHDMRSDEIDLITGAGGKTTVGGGIHTTFQPQMHVTVDVTIEISK